MRGQARTAVSTKDRFRDSQAKLFAGLYYTGTDMNSRHTVISTIAVAAGLFIVGAIPMLGQPAFPIPGDDATGFESIFDGKTLKGWEGDPKLWRVEDGVLVGEITADTLLKQNSFIIWRGGVTRDFELKLEYRISTGNSGINYRSTEVPGVPLGLRGYQADIDGPNQWTGQNYEERGRTFLALRGQATRIEDGKKPHIIASLGDKDQLKSLIKSNDWNELHLIVRGNLLAHILNGQLMSMVVDDDTKNRRADGLLGLQVHVGPPMRVDYRNIRFKSF